MGTRIGSCKAAARRLGLSLAVYLGLLTAREKWCYRCREWKPRAAFWVDSTRGDGRKAICKQCDYARQTPGPSKAKRREMRITGRSWCRQCADWRPTLQVHAGLCRPHANETTRRLYRESRRFRMSRRQHSHSRKRGVDPIPAEAQEMLIEEFGGRCAYCGRSASTWDHVIPVMQGGRTTPSNIVPACAPCNSSKRDQNVFEWLEATGRNPSDRFFERLVLAECGLSPLGRHHTPASLAR